MARKIRVRPIVFVPLLDLPDRAAGDSEHLDNVLGAVTCLNQRKDFLTYFVHRGIT